MTHEIDHKAQAKATQNRLSQAAKEGQGDGRGYVGRGVVRRVRVDEGQGSFREERDDGDRANRELPRASGCGVYQQRNEGRVQSVLSWQPRDQRIRHALRYDHNTHRRSGEHVQLQRIPKLVLVGVSICERLEWLARQDLWSVLPKKEPRLLRRVEIGPQKMAVVGPNHLRGEEIFRDILVRGRSVRDAEGSVHRRLESVVAPPEDLGLGPSRRSVARHFHANVPVAHTIGPHGYATATPPQSR